MKMFRTSYKAH